MKTEKNLENIEHAKAILILAKVGIHSNLYKTSSDLPEGKAKYEKAIQWLETELKKAEPNLFRGLNE